MSHKAEDVEQAIIDVLKADAWLGSTANVKVIDRYDGRFNTEDAGSILTGLPGIFVAFAFDRNIPVTTGTTYKQRSQFNVVVAVSDQSGKFKAKQTALDITQRVHDLLHLNQLGLEGVYPGLEREGRLPQIINKFLAVYELTFNIEWVA